MWVLLLPVQVTVLGAQVAPEVVRGAFIRLKLFTVGFVIAANAEACFIMPPKKYLPFSERPNSAVWLVWFASIAKIFVFAAVPGASQTEICA